MADFYFLRGGRVLLLIPFLALALCTLTIEAQQVPVVPSAEVKAEKAQATQDPAAEAQKAPAAQPPAGKNQEAGDVQPAAAPKGDGLLRFAFEGTPWREVIKWLAEESELALQVQDLPGGSFTYSDPKSFTHQEAIDRINLFLLAQGYTLVRSGKLLSLINLGDPRSLQQLEVLAKLVTPEQLDKLTDHDVVKCIFALDEIKAEDAAVELTALKLMLPPAVFAKTNRLMITDTVRKLKSVKLILDAFEPSALDSGMVMKNFPLEHVDAEDILIVVRPHLGLATGEMIGIDVSLSSDLLGKNIFVTGVDDKVKMIQGLIEALDKPEEDLLPGEEAVLQTHSVQGGNLETIYNVLQTLLAGKEARLTMDAAAGSIVALAAPDVQKEIAQTVSQLQATEAEFEIIPLRNIDPYFAISLLEQMLDLSGLQAQAQSQSGFQSGGDFDRRSDRDRDRDRERERFSRSVSRPKVEIDVPKIDADPGNMRLFVRAKKPMMERIKKIVAQLDASTGIGESNDNIRLFPLKGKRAEHVVETAAQFWRAANPIILYSPVVNPLSEQSERVVTEQTAVEEPASPPRVKSALSVPRVLAGDIRSRLPAIRCEVTPRCLLLQSDDTEALDQFYRHLQTIAGPVSSIPSPPVVFYLKYTKPEDALRILAELLDGGDAATEGEAGTLVNGYVASPGNSLLGSLVVSRSGTTTMTAGTITIVADGRLNRLIAQGTAEDIEIVENYLKIVDKDNSITSVETYGRSHVIELVHTRANEVAQMIREAYSGRVSGGTGSRQSGQSGRSGSSQGQREGSSSKSPSSGRSEEKSEEGEKKSSEKKPTSQPPRTLEPKMTIAVHEASNSLIVTAPDQLFKEVEQLVKIVDSRNEQTVRIITHTNAGGIHSVLQQVLSGGTRPSGSRTGSSPSRSSGAVPQSSPSRSSSGGSRSSPSPGKPTGVSRGSSR